MKLKRIIFGIISLLYVTVMITSCDLENFMKDEDGNNIPILLLDLPKFDAEYAFNIVDVMNSIPYEEKVTIKVDGKSAGKIITDLGEKNNGNFTTSAGELYLYLEPNEKVSGDPIEFSVSGEGSNYIITSYNVEQKVAGRFDATIGVIPLSKLPSHSSYDNTPLKSASQKQAYEVVDSKGNPVNVIPFASKVSNGLGTIAVGIISGSDDYTAKNVANGLTVEMDKYKMYTIVNEKYKEQRTSTVNIDLKGTGSFSGMYRITTAENVVTSANLSGTLPIKRAVAGISSTGDIKVELIPHSPYQSSPAQTVSNNGGTASFNIVKNSSSPEKLYNLNVEIYVESEGLMAIRPTKELKIKNAKLNDAPWIPVSFKEGVADVYLIENDDYIARINFDNENHEFEFTTDINKIKEYQDKFPEIKSLKITQTPEGYKLEVKVQADVSL